MLEALIQQLNQLADQKAQDYLQRDDIVALAVTGSLARNRIWEGSDLDLWGFTADGEPDFEDGTVDEVYWEIDIKPVAWLQQHNDPSRWLYPTRLWEDEITPLEAFWGCRIITDRHGALTEIKTAVDSCVGDWDWLRRRADHYLSMDAAVWMRCNMPSRCGRLSPRARQRHATALPHIGCGGGCCSAAESAYQSA